MNLTMFGVKGPEDDLDEESTGELDEESTDELDEDYLDGGDEPTETYGEFLERTGLEDTDQTYEKFINGYYDD